MSVKQKFAKAEYHPRVSIIIPVYNGSNYMREAIDSALAQTYDDIEIIVVNDGSSDNGETARIAHSYGDKIRYFEKANGGVATALNLGIEKMTGEYFSWLSHDDMYLPDKIKEEVLCLLKQEDPTVIIAEGCQIVDASGEKLFNIDISGMYTEEQMKNPVFLLMRGAIQGCGLLIHKSHFRRVGLFNPELPTTQDYDLWFRMFRGQKICYMNTFNVLSRSHDEQGSKQQLSIHLEECDSLWIHMIDSLTPMEKEEMNGSEYAFYHDLWVFLQSCTVYRGATQYARHMMDQATIEQICYEFSNLLYDVTEEHNRINQALEDQCARLKEKCRDYERQLSRFSPLLRFWFWIYGILMAPLNIIKKEMVKAAKLVFHLGKQFVIRFGIKDKLKKTKIFRKLYQKGIIDKLRE